MGGPVINPAEGFIVLNKEGPLQDGELARATAWARQIAARRQSEKARE